MDIAKHIVEHAILGVKKETVSELKYREVRIGFKVVGTHPAIHENDYGQKWVWGVAYFHTGTKKIRILDS